ncbi:hypothetical protein M514_01075 [Trichuris suis]|uniref:Uncharacterized protein n=1 Tax=Trichuris suis TaxID=68888 RepID=A0A085MKU6_9BILA|nr:hypothetical protein M513_01075 [Trichuris suis]KFD61885.1 hypothetical protein M514_01075 [Trichuris suis]
MESSTFTDEELNVHVRAIDAGDGVSGESRKFSHNFDFNNKSIFNVPEGTHVPGEPISSLKNNYTLKALYKLRSRYVCAGRIK